MPYHVPHPSDEELMRTNPEQFIVVHQEVIRIAIRSYIRSGAINSSEHDDMVQQVNEELLKRLAKIRCQFKGAASARSYLSAIVSNVCINILRKKRKTDETQFRQPFTEEAGDNILYALVLKDEIQKLKNILRLCFGQEAKLILCLKLKYRLAFTFGDFKKVYPPVSETDFTLFVRKTHPYETCTDGTIYTAFTEISNTYEHKQNTPDALRKWTEKKTSEVIGTLNGHPPTSAYNEETLGILFEKYVYNETITLHPNASQEVPDASTRNTGLGKP